MIQSISEKKALLGGGRVWLERRSSLLLPFEAKSQLASPSRLSGDCSGFLGHGCKQVPPELIGGKILWAHPDGYFLNAQGQKVKHDFGPSKQRATKGSCYPCMRGYGNKNCHALMYEAFYGSRTKGMEIDHLNGNKLDYRPSNLQEVTPAENRRRAKILRAMRAAGLEPSTYSRDELLAIFGKYDVGDPHAAMLHDMTHHMEC